MDSQELSKADDQFQKPDFLTYKSNRYRDLSRVGAGFLIATGLWFVTFSIFLKTVNCH